MSDEGIQLHDIARVAHIGLGGALPGYKGKLSEIEYKVIAKAVAEFVTDAKPDQPHYDKMRGIAERLVSPDDAGLGALIADARELLNTLNTYDKAREVLAAAEPIYVTPPQAKGDPVPSEPSTVDALIRHGEREQGIRHVAAEPNEKCPNPQCEACDALITSTRDLAKSVDHMLCNLLQIVHTVKNKWEAENVWSEWDQQVLENARAVHRKAITLAEART